MILISPMNIWQNKNKQKNTWVWFSTKIQQFHRGNSFMFFKSRDYVFSWIWKFSFKCNGLSESGLMVFLPKKMSLDKNK